MARNFHVILRGASQAVLAATLGAVLVAPVQALQWETGGGVKIAFDTTLTYGLSLRTEDPERTNFANQYGNRAIFKDKWDIFANSVRASHDVVVSGDSWEVFGRGNYFYDQAIASETDKLQDAAENRAVQHGDITDLFGKVTFGADDRFTLRAGKQVISWGESAFIGTSINDINTFDVSKVRQPGVEIKDALVGTPSIDLTWVATDALSLEGFVLLGYDEAKADPAGTFFATLDGALDGAGFDDSDGVIDGACRNPDTTNDSPSPPFHLAPTLGCSFGGLLRAPGDDIPSAGGQWGVAVRYYLPNVGAGLETGFYYQNLHAHAPNFSAIAGTPGGAPGTFNVGYAKDIERWGASYNTVVGPWALGGEFSYRRNEPLQGAEFFYNIFGLTVNAAGTALTPVGAPAPGTPVRGYTRYENFQVQNTFQRLWGPIHDIGADQLVTFGEVMWGWSGSFPDNSTLFNDTTSSDWGTFQMINNLTYNNLLLNRINVTYKSALRYDFHGLSPQAAGQTAIEGKKVVSLGVEFDYAQRWKWGVDHTWFFNGDNECTVTGGFGIGNGGNFLPKRCYSTDTDRDFLSFNLSYTF